MLDHVVSAAIDPWAYVVPILLDQPHHQAVHLGLAGGGWGLCLGSCYAQEQRHRDREAQHCQLPDPRMHHHHTSVAKRYPTRDPPHPDSWMWGSPLSVARAVRGGAGAIVVHGLKAQTLLCAARAGRGHVQLSAKHFQTVSEAPGCTGYLHGFSCLHALISQVWPMSPPSQPEKAQSSMIFGSTTTSMGTPKSGMVSKFSNL